MASILFLPQCVKNCSCYKIWRILTTHNQDTLGQNSLTHCCLATHPLLHCTGPSLLHVCHLMLITDLKEWTSVKFESKYKFYFRKINLKMSSARWQPFRLSLIALRLPMLQLNQTNRNKSVTHLPIFVYSDYWLPSRIISWNIALSWNGVIKHDNLDLRQTTITSSVFAHCHTCINKSLWIRG